MKLHRNGAQEKTQQTVIKYASNTKKLYNEEVHDLMQCTWHSLGLLNQKRWGLWDIQVGMGKMWWCNQLTD